MTKEILNIIDTATRKGACPAVKNITVWNDAINLLLSPQGREFALKTKYPSIQAFRDNYSKLSEFSTIHIDAGNIELYNTDCILVGDTYATIYTSSNDRLLHVIAMHGAKVKIEAHNYAVITATVIDSLVDVYNDGTAKVEIEMK